MNGERARKMREAGDGNGREGKQQQVLNCRGPTYPDVVPDLQRALRGEDLGHGPGVWKVVEINLHGLIARCIQRDENATRRRQQCVARAPRNTDRLVRHCRARSERSHAAGIKRR